MTSPISRLSRRLIPLAAAAALAQGASAHHSFAAEFDSTKPITVEGNVTKARLVNPHSWLYLDVRNKDGSITNWGFEFGTPLSLHVKGVSKEDVAFGTHVKVEGFLSRNGGAFGYARLVTFPGGRQVLTGGAADAPAPATAAR